MTLINGIGGIMAIVLIFLLVLRRSWSSRADSIARDDVPGDNVDNAGNRGSRSKEVDNSSNKRRK